MERRMQACRSGLGPKAGSSQFEVKKFSSTTHKSHRFGDAPAEIYSLSLLSHIMLPHVCCPFDFQVAFRTMFYRFCSSHRIEHLEQKNKDLVHLSRTHFGCTSSGD